MTSAERKLKRKRKNKVYKSFNRAIKTFRSMVNCSKCAREPYDGEAVDNWHVAVSETGMELTCEECLEVAENDKES